MPQSGMLAEMLKQRANRTAGRLARRGGPAGGGRKQKGSIVKRLRNVAVLAAGLWLGLATSGRAQSASPPVAAAAAPVRLLVVYDSTSGNTEQMAQAVVEGARGVAGVDVLLRKIDQATAEELRQAQGIVLGCPTYFANIPGRMKIVLDDWNWKWKVDFTDKVGGAFATGGGPAGGKEHVVQSLLLFMLSNRMIVAGPLYGNPQSGSVWGEPGVAAMTGPLDPGISDSERQCAQRLGQRVATLTLRWSRTAGP